LGAVATGETAIEGLLEGEDVLATAAAAAALGAAVRREGPGSWRVAGLGTGGLAEPDRVLDMGNSGTGVRLLLGLLASHPFSSVLTGDESLRRRPMDRVTAPLEQMGARFVARAGGRLPLTVMGAAEALPIHYAPPVASAQVKSAILLAALNAPGETTVIEALPTRDHTERMLGHFGARITIEDTGKGRAVRLAGEPELAGRAVRVPADISSAAFPMAAALLCPDSAVVLPDVGINPLRAGLLTTLEEMGADIALTNPREEAGEPVADIAVRSGPLRAADTPPERAPSMIDEFPILAVLAAAAEGTSRLRGLGELRVKESDRFAAILEGLAACGARVEAEGEDILIHGAGRPPAGGATVGANHDHRIAMAFLVLGLGAAAPVRVTGAETIATSFPGFTDLMAGLGARIECEDEAS
ncbi:MAG: 3-phosphoshikimate 1-carboxyvinyltransferase, partial [Rhodospirillaceae bacterium]|nr:3-phosphoshikimate 1-carboxyvinyltransferase [Rhodospirillaceae bacterium]